MPSARPPASKGNGETGRLPWQSAPPSADTRPTVEAAQTPGRFESTSAQQLDIPQTLGAAGPSPPRAAGVQNPGGLPSSRVVLGAAIAPRSMPLLGPAQPAAGAIAATSTAPAIIKMTAALSALPVSITGAQATAVGSRMQPSATPLAPAFGGANSRDPRSQVRSAAPARPSVSALQPFAASQAAQTASASLTAQSGSPVLANKAPASPKSLAVRSGMQPSSAQPAATFGVGRSRDPRIQGRSAVPLQPFGATPDAFPASQAAQPAPSSPPTQPGSPAVASQAAASAQAAPSLADKPMAQAAPSHMAGQGAQSNKPSLQAALPRPARLGSQGSADIQQHRPPGTSSYAGPPPWIKPMPAHPRACGLSVLPRPEGRAPGYQGPGPAYSRQEPWNVASGSPRIAGGQAVQQAQGFPNLLLPGIPQQQQQQPVNAASSTRPRAEASTNQPYALSRPGLASLPEAEGEGDSAWRVSASSF